MDTIATEVMPTRAGAFAFRFKAACFRARRFIRNIGNLPPRHARKAVDGGMPILAESRSVLYTSEREAEFGLQAGKVQNLRVAARALNGITISSNEVFSFWRQVPRPRRRRGFVAGRELREGCVIPAIGGGLCQLSNALYDAALMAGFEILERHPHSRIVPGSAAALGRDATIFWNYVDLRFRPQSDVQLEVILGRGELVVRFRGVSPAHTGEGDANPERVPAGDAVESCETCEVTQCFRHAEVQEISADSITAWLVDAYWPEYDVYLVSERKEKDWLFLPLAARKYPWTRDGFSRIQTAPSLVVKRSFQSRRLAAQGAARQQALLGFDEEFATSYARRIPAAATHLVVAQSLLPFLWREGVLGGRTFDVLMTRLPMSHLEATLDRAARQWPDSPTLADFRADPELVEAERVALAEARYWITPHSEVFTLAEGRGVKLDWILPDGIPPFRFGDRFLFPASTLGRKGAWEMRKLDVPLSLAGPILESHGFWDGMEVKQGEFDLDGIKAVVLPAWIENQPRRLLQAVAAGVPVIASEACGLDGMEGVVTVRTGDTENLREAIDSIRQGARGKKS